MSYTPTTAQIRYWTGGDLRLGLEPETDAFGFDIHDGETDDEYFQSRGEYYCKHGVYTGSPGGADYMCGYCEDGVSDEEYAAILKTNREYEEREQRRKRGAREWIICVVTGGDIAGCNIWQNGEV